MAHQIRWGVLGCARIARLEVIPAIQRCANATLQAIASREPGKLPEFHDLFGEFTDHQDYEALLDDAQVDAIYLPLPNSLHCEWAIKAMRKGKHVLCEKPLALNAREALSMSETAEECGVLLMEAFMYRYTDRCRKVQAILDSGVLGEIRSINSTFRFLLNRPNTIKERPELGGGALYDVGCYPLNLIGLITQDEPESVAVECHKRNGIDVNLSALMRFKGGIIASLHCGFDAHARMSSEIIGTEGSLVVPDTFLDNAGQLLLSTAQGTREIEVVPSDRYAAEIEDFSASILARRSPALCLSESLRNMRTLERLVAARDACR